MSAETLSAQSADEALGLLQLAHLHFRFEALDPLRLPSFKGSMFRGALGTTLKRVLCLRQSPTACEECRLMEVCRYPELFDTRHSPRRTPRYLVPPPPFALVLPADARTEVAPGEEVHCGLVLVGSAVDDASIFVSAFAEMGRRGFGKGRGRCRLVQFESLAPGEGGEKGVRRQSGGIVALNARGIVADRSSWRNANRWRLEFLTPVRLKYRGRLLQSVDFAVLVHRMAERIEALSRLYGEGGRIDVTGLLDLANSVQLEDSGVWWDDWQRYSSRQNVRMRLGGFRGTVVLRGSLSPFVPLLALGEWLNVGKGPTFGLGRFKLHPDE